MVMKDSIEEGMLQIQESKENLGKGSFAKLKRKELEKTGLDTMRRLFEVDDAAVQSWDVFHHDGGEAFLADTDDELDNS